MNYKEAKDYFANEIPCPKVMTLLGILADNDIVKGMELIKELTSCDNNTAKLLWDDLIRDYGTRENNPIFEITEKYEKQLHMRDDQYDNDAEEKSSGEESIYFIWL